MNKLDWKEVEVFGTTFKKVFSSAEYWKAIQLMRTLQEFRDKGKYIDIDFSGMKSVIALLESDYEHESGYFDPINPIQPQEAFPGWFK